MIPRLLLLLAATITLLLVAFTPATAAAQETALVVPIRGPGASERALENATHSLRRRLEARGFTVRVLAENVPEAAVSVEDLAALGAAQSADLVVDGVLQDFAGMTSLQIRVVQPDGTLLGEDANLTRPETLPQDVAVVLANALRTVPHSSASPQPGEEGLDSPFAGPAVRQRPSEGPGQVEPVPPPQRQNRARRRRPSFPERHFWIGALIEPAMGTNRSSFNLLLGGRGEFQWRGLTVGLGFTYAYLKDWEPRSNPDYHTMAMFGMIGYQIRLGSDRLSLPILAGGGYVPGNGGLLRFEAGLSIRPVDRLEVRLIFVCPNFWFLDEEMVLFTSISLGLHFGI